MCKFKEHIFWSTWYLGYQVPTAECFCRQTVLQPVPTPSHINFKSAEWRQMQTQTHTLIKMSADSSSRLREQQPSVVMDVLPSSLFHCVAQRADCVVMISEPLLAVTPAILHQITLHIKKTYVICEGISSLRLHSSFISLCRSSTHLSYLESKFCSSVSFRKFRKRILVAFDGLTALLCAT